MVKRTRSAPSRTVVWSISALLAAITFSLSLLWFFWLPALAIVPTLIAAYLPFYFDRSEYYPNNSRVWPALQKWKLFKYTMSVYSPQIASVSPATQKLFDEGKQVILAQHPHGVFVHHGGMFQTDCCGYITKIYPNAPPRRTLGANILFKIPFFRDYILWFGTIDAGPRNANNALAQGMTLHIVTGGEHEQLLSNDQAPVLVIKKRKGIARLALHYNVPIVPVFVFGEDNLYETSDWLLEQRLAIVKKYRVAITFQKGRYGLPFLPKRVPLIAVIGDPVQLTEDERSNKELRRGHDGKYDHNDADVTLLLEKYANAMTKLYEDNKEKYSTYKKKDAPITII